MKKIIASLVAVFIVITSFAQTKAPVNFTYKAVKKTETSYEIVITATIDKPWHLYSQNTDKGGPVPTTITFKANPLIKLVGKPAEKGKMQKTHDKTFDVNVMYYSDKVDFVQTITVKPNTKTSISGVLEYMVCDDERCLPPKKVNFTVQL